MSQKYNKELRHIVQTLMAQVVDVNNHVRALQDNEEMPEADKIATTNFAHYHLMVLAILLNDVKEFARKNFPDAHNILDWAAQHYKLGLDKKSFTPCKCSDCPQPEQTPEEIEKDNKILDGE